MPEKCRQSLFIQYIKRTMQTRLEKHRKLLQFNKSWNDIIFNKNILKLKFNRNLFLLYCIVMTVDDLVLLHV